MCNGSGWATGTHMTELSAYGARVHVTGALRVSWGGHPAEWADVLGALGANMVSRLTLEASDHDRCGGRGIGDVDGIRTGAGSHNHFQSSRECNMSRAPAWSSSSVVSTPTPLSRHCISAVAFSRSEGGCGGTTGGKGESSSGQLGERVDCGISGGQRVGGRGGSSWTGRAQLNIGNRGSMVFLFLNCSLHCVIGVIVGLPLSLR